MKSIFRKRKWAFFGLLFSIASIVLLLCAIPFLLFEEQENHEDSIELGLLAWNTLLSFVSMVFYFVDQIKHLTFKQNKRVISKIQSNFWDKSLLWLVVVGFPAFILLDIWGNLQTIIFLTYHLVIFVLITVDIIRAFKNTKKKLFVFLSFSQEEINLVLKPKIIRSPEIEFLGFWSNITTEPNQREICINSIAATINHFLTSEKEEIYFGFDAKDLDELLIRVDMEKCELIKLQPEDFIKNLCV